MQKDIIHLVKQVTAFGIGDLLIKSAAIILIPIYTRVLTVSDYGILGILAPISAILMYIYSFGLNSAVMRYDVELKTEDERRTAHGTAWVFLVLFAIATTTVLAISSQQFWSWLFPSIPFYPFALLIFGTAALESLAIVPMALMKIRGNARKYSLIRVIQFIFVTALIIVMVVVFRLGVKGQLIAILIGSLGFGVVYGVMALREIKINLNFKYLKQYLTYSIPMIPSGLSLWVLSLSSILILQRLSSLEEVGLFVLGIKFGLVLDILVSCIILAWQPFFFKKAESKEAPELFALIGTYYLVFILGIGVAIILGSQQVLHLLTPPQFFEAGSIVAIVICGVIIKGVYYFTIQSIQYTKKTYYLPFIDGTAAVVNVILCFLLIPTYGIIGAGLATTIAYSVQLTCGFVVSKRLYPLTYEYSRLIRVAIVYLVVYASLSHLAFDSDLWTLLARLGLLPLFILAGLVILRVPRDGEILWFRQILRKIVSRGSPVST